MLHSWQLLRKKAKKIFKAFVLLPHLFFTVAVAAMGREEQLDHTGSRRKELTKNPLDLQNPAQNGGTGRELNV